MKFLKFKAENLFSFKSVNFDLNERGLVLINGWSEDENSHNGSGKSSLTSKGLVWALYGKTTSGRKGDEVIQRGSTSCYGEVEIISNDGNIYSIRRERGPSKLSVFKKSDLLLDEDISCKIQSETQELIDQLIGKDYETFLNTDFFGQGFSASFMTLPSQQQNALLETAISLEQINMWIDNAKELKRTTKQDASDLEEDYFLLHGRLCEIRKAKKEQELKNKSYSSQLAELTAKLKNKDLSSLEKRDKELNDSYTKGEKQFLQCTETLNKLQRERSSLLAAKKVVKQNLCPTCDQQIDTNKYNVLLEEQIQIVEKLTDTDRSIKAVQSSTNQWLAYCTEKKKEREIVQKDLAEAKLIESKIKSITDFLIAQTDWYAKELLILQEREKIEKELPLVTEKLNIVDFWESAFKVDFKSFIFERICPFLEQQATKHLRNLGQPQMTVKFSTVKELKSGENKISFNITIESSSGGESFDSFSGGEQQFVSFAVGLAFADLVKKTTHNDSNIMILDEPFVYIDNNNAERFINYLQNYLSKEKETILLVSNENCIKELVPNKVLIEKRHGISTITYGANIL